MSKILPQNSQDIINSINKLIEINNNEIKSLPYQEQMNIHKLYYINSSLQLNLFDMLNPNQDHLNNILNFHSQKYLKIIEIKNKKSFVPKIIDIKPHLTPVSVSNDYDDTLDNNLNRDFDRLDDEDNTISEQNNTTYIHRDDNSEEAVKKTQKAETEAEKKAQEERLKVKEEEARNAAEEVNKKAKKTEEAKAEAIKAQEAQEEAKARKAEAVEEERLKVKPTENPHIQVTIGSNVYNILQEYYIYEEWGEKPNKYPTLSSLNDAEINYSTGLSEKYPKFHFNLIKTISNNDTESANIYKLIITKREEKEAGDIITKYDNEVQQEQDEKNIEAEIPDTKQKVLTPEIIEIPWQNRQIQLSSPSSEEAIRQQVVVDETIDIQAKEAKKAEEAKKKPTVVKVKINYGSYTHDGNNDYMEDFIVAKKINDNVVLAVFDGHGSDKVSDMCSKNLDKVIDLSIGERIPALDKIAVDEKLEGGSTGVIVKIYPNGCIEIERTGDSEAILCVLEEGSNTYNCINLAECDHSAGSIDEFSRLMDEYNATSVDFSYSFNNNENPRNPFVFIDNKWEVNPNGGYIKSDVNGGFGVYFKELASTRAIGDNHAKKYGIISTPATQKLSLEKCTYQVIIIGSDGLFDIYTREEIYKIASDKEFIGDGDKASEQILKSAMEKGQKLYRSDQIDNISVIVAYIKVECDDDITTIKVEAADRADKADVEKTWVEILESEMKKETDVGKIDNLKIIIKLLKEYVLSSDFTYENYKKYIFYQVALYRSDLVDSIIILNDLKAEHYPVVKNIIHNVLTETDNVIQNVLKYIKSLDKIEVYQEHINNIIKQINTATEDVNDNYNIFDFNKKSQNSISYRDTEIGKVPEDIITKINILKDYKTKLLTLEEAINKEIKYGDTYTTIKNTGGDDVAREQYMLISIMDYLKITRPDEIGMNMTITDFRTRFIPEKLIKNWPNNMDFNMESHVVMNEKGLIHNNGIQNQLEILMNLCNIFRLKLFIIENKQQINGITNWKPVVEIISNNDREERNKVNEVYILHTPNHFELLVSGPAKHLKRQNNMVRKITHPLGIKNKYLKYKQKYLQLKKLLKKQKLL